MGGGTLKEVQPQEAEADEESRETWSNHCEFFLSSLGLAVGLGNVWRFPYVCYINGGGTFLIPYISVLLLIGIPGLFLEQAIGQFARTGVNKVYGRMAPMFKGFGYSVILILAFSELYYAVICGWGFYYLFVGFASELPWSTCNDTSPWHSQDCFLVSLEKECQGSGRGDTYWNLTCVDYLTYCQNHGFETFNSTSQECVRGSSGNQEQVSVEKLISKNGVSPAEDYFNGEVLGFTLEDGSRSSWDNYGSLRWQPAVCLVVVWVVENLILYKGIQFYGKIAYFITLSPYVVLTAFMVYGASLPGAADGISYLLSPDWDKLWDINVWYNAASQILLSLSLGMGTQLALSSFNDFRNNVLRDAILIALFNSATSIFAGFVVFAILGFLANVTRSEVPDVVHDGITLAFVSYPSALLEMDLPPLWSFMFFFMLINLAISSGCAGVQTLATFITDEFPRFRRGRRSQVVVGVSVVLLLLGLPLCCNGGILLFTLFDRRCSSSLIFILWIEIMVVAWVYGVDNFNDNLVTMGMTAGMSRPHGLLRWTFRIVYAILLPVILIAVVIIAWKDREPLSYDGKEFPVYAEAIGWLLELGPLIFAVVAPFVKFRQLWRADPTVSFKDAFVKLLKPTEKWLEPVEKHLVEIHGFDHEGFELGEHRPEVHFHAKNGGGGGVGVGPVQETTSTHM